MIISNSTTDLDKAKDAVSINHLPEAVIHSFFTDLLLQGDVVGAIHLSAVSPDLRAIFQKDFSRNCRLLYDIQIENVTAADYQNHDTTFVARYARFKMARSTHHELIRKVKQSQADSDLARRELEVRIRLGQFRESISIAFALIPNLGKVAEGYITDNLDRASNAELNFLMASGCPSLAKRAKESLAERLLADTYGENIMSAKRLVSALGEAAVSYVEAHFSEFSDHQQVDMACNAQDPMNDYAKKVLSSRLVIGTFKPSNSDMAKQLTKALDQSVYRYLALYISD